MREDAWNQCRWQNYMPQLRKTACGTTKMNLCGPVSLTQIIHCTTTPWWMMSCHQCSSIEISTHTNARVGWAQLLNDCNRAPTWRGGTLAPPQRACIPRQKCLHRTVCIDWTTTDIQSISTGINENSLPPSLARAQGSVGNINGSKLCDNLIGQLDNDSWRAGHADRVSEKRR